jgi:hypothetical protein
MSCCFNTVSRNSSANKMTDYTPLKPIFLPSVLASKVSVCNFHLSCLFSHQNSSKTGLFSTEVVSWLVMNLFSCINVNYTYFSSQ